MGFYVKTYRILYLFLFQIFLNIIVGGDCAEDDENVEEDEDDDVEHTTLKLPALGKRSFACSSKDTLDFDANRYGTRSGTKHLFNSLAQGVMTVVKNFTDSKKTPEHDEVHRAVSSRKKKFLIMEQNEDTEGFDKARCVTLDSQSYEIVNAVVNDGKAVHLDSQTIP